MTKGYALHYGWYNLEVVFINNGVYEKAWSKGIIGKKAVEDELYSTLEDFKEAHKRCLDRIRGLEEFEGNTYSHHLGEPQGAYAEDAGIYGWDLD